MLKIIIFFESTNPRYNLSVWNTEGKYFLLVCSFHILMLFFFHTSTSSFYYKYNSAAFHEVRYLQLFIVCYMQPYFHNEKLFSFVYKSSRLWYSIIPAQTDSSWSIINEILHNCINQFLQISISLYKHIPSHWFCFSGEHWLIQFPILAPQCLEKLVEWAG